MLQIKKKNVHEIKNDNFDSLVYYNCFEKF